jgi:hypothetical protein
MSAMRLQPYDGPTQVFAEDGRAAGTRFNDEDDVLDNWLGSLSTVELERILNGLAACLANAPSALDPPA